MSSTPIILATGWATPSTRLGPLSHHLARVLDREPVPFDLAHIAFDASRLPVPDNEPSDYARALHEKLCGLPEPARLIGWSTGGLIALETAFFWPDTIHRLVLINSTACFCSKDDYPHGQKPAILRAMMSGLRLMPSKPILREFFARVALPHAILHEELQAHVADALAQGETTLLNGLAYLLHTDLRDKVPHIRQPALILHGTKDHIIPATAGEWICDHMPDAICKLEDDRGHDMPLRYPEEIAQHVRDFSFS